MMSYTWNLGRSFSIAESILTKMNSNEEVSPVYLYDLYLAVNVAVEENMIFNTKYRTRLSINAGEFNLYSEALRIITYKSIKGILNEEDMTVLKAIIMDFSTLGQLLRNDNRISYGEYNKVKDTLQLLSGRINPYEYTEKNWHILNDEK